MSKLPTVAIIGRPNTGKSTLFNRLIGKRKAIESTIPGTTRDHISHRIDTEEMSYLLIDTGGIGSTQDKDFEKDVAGQSLLALENADLILFTVNAKEPVTADDQKILDLLRKKRRRHVPVLVILTKADNPALTQNVLADFQEMNMGEAFIAVSAPHRLGIEELEGTIVKELKKVGFEKQASGDQGSEISSPRIAIIGRPNVGKSSIVNAVMSDVQREKSPLLVSPVAGTTRDSVDTEIRYQGKPYTLVDTAGLKKRSRTTEELERLSMLRTISAIEQSDVVLLVLDALLPVSQQDKRIAALTIENGKGLVILANKMDGLSGDARRTKLAEIAAHLFFCRFVRILPCSAKTREGLLKIFDVIESVQLSRIRRIPTRELRHWFEQTMHGLPMGELARCKHMTQANEVPPTFVLFVKQAKRVRPSDLKFLERRLRETFGFDGVPIRWITKSSEPRKND
jgi:GTP-binding protein